MITRNLDFFCSYSFGQYASWFIFVYSNGVTQVNSFSFANSSFLVFDNVNDDDDDTFCLTVDIVIDNHMSEDKTLTYINVTIAVFFTNS